MTTPLFIGESVPLEVRNIINSLSIGAHVRYKNIEGFIDFICDDYITICSVNTNMVIHLHVVQQPNAVHLCIVNGGTNWS